MSGQDLIEVDDERLIERIQRGDEAAFRALFDRHQGPIYRYAMHMCGPAAADDVVQDTFLALIRQAQGERRGFDPSRGTVGAYLFGIARHHVLKRLNDCGLRIADRGFDDDGHSGNPQSALLNPQLSPLADLERAESIAMVRQAVSTLPPVYREAIVLCELQEMDYADAAAVLECPVGTVRSRLHRARALLTRKLAGLKEDVAGVGSK